MAKKRRSCPRGLYDGCPIPRELCSEDYVRTGAWHCLELLSEFEAMVFGTDEDDLSQVGEDPAMEGEIVSLEDLIKALGETEG
jgi:hypothetical protein